MVGLGQSNSPNLPNLNAKMSLFLSQLNEMLHIKYFFSEFSVGALENLLIDMQGMGFLNGMMNKVVLNMVSQNIHNLLMTTGKEFMRKEFIDFSLIDHMYSTFKIL